MGQIKDQLTIIILNENEQTRRELEQNLLDLSLKPSQILTGDNLADALKFVREIPSKYGLIIDLNLDNAFDQNIKKLKEVRKDGYQIPVMHYGPKRLQPKQDLKFKVNYGGKNFNNSTPKSIVAQDSLGTIGLYIKVYDSLRERIKAA